MGCQQPAEIYSKPPSKRLLRVIFHRKTAKKAFEAGLSREILAYKKIEVPSYTRLTKLILGDQLAEARNRLFTPLVIETWLTNLRTEVRLMRRRRKSPGLSSATRSPIDSISLHWNTSAPSSGITPCSTASISSTGSSSAGGGAQKGSPLAYKITRYSEFRNIPSCRSVSALRA